MIKKVLLISWTLALTLLFGQNWQIINNVNHVYDLEKDGDSIYFSSWGGVTEIEGSDALPLSQREQVQQLSTGDGLVSNDIRHLSLIDVSNSLWMGSSQDGISSLGEQGMLSVDESLGLPSLRINRLLEVDSRILVATGQGLCVFYYLEDVNFPMMLSQYNSTNTAGALPNHNIYDMILSDNNILYMAHDMGISYVHIDSLEVNSAWKNLSTMPAFPIIGDLRLSSSKDHLALSAYGRIWVRRNDSDTNPWRVLRPYDSSLQWPISTIHLDNENQLWVAYGEWDNDKLIYKSPSDTLLTRVDLTSLDTVQWERNTDGFGLNHISRIKEFDGEIYICTWGDGIARYKNDEWEYFQPDNIAFPKITMSKTDHNNALWFASGIIGDYVVRKGTMGVSAYKDGHWLSFNTDNSPLHSNNILNLEVDAQNRKWFGAWWTDYNQTGNRYGLSIYDDRDDSWQWISHESSRMWNYDMNNWGPELEDGPTLLTSTIGGIYRDRYDNMFVLSYDGGVNVLKTYEDSLVVHSKFRLPNAPHQRVVNAYHNGRQYFFGTEYDNGLSIWNHDSIPEEDGDYWLQPNEIVQELRDGKIYGVTSVQSPYSPSGWQHFVASGAGLFMWDELYWYRYDVYIKRYRFDPVSQNWANDTLYYADEERLFGSTRTYPLSIYGDPFGRVWVGSEAHGLSMYDPVHERFTNYYQGNSPLLSNQIISLGYDPLEGRLLIGTTEGLNTLRIGRTEKPETDLQELKVFPNPFRPNGHNYAQIVNLPLDSMPGGKNECRIYSSSGQLVRKLEENLFSRFEWDGKNKEDKLVSSGVYFFVVTDADGNTARGKLAIIR